MWVAELCKLINKQDTSAGPLKAHPVSWCTASSSQPVPRAEQRSHEDGDREGLGQPSTSEHLAQSCQHSVRVCRRDRGWEGFLLRPELGLPEQMCQLVSKGQVKKGIQIHNQIQTDLRKKSALFVPTLNPKQQPCFKRSQNDFLLI